MYARKKQWWIPWVMVLPVLLIRGFTSIYPILSTFRNSFYDIRLLKGINEFCGLSNYIKIFQDEKLLPSVEFSVIFVITSMFFHIVLGVILALILNMRFKGRRFLRTVVLIPWAMAATAVGIAAKWAFNNDYGLVNDLVRRFVPDFTLPWLVNTVSARAAVIMVDLWKDIPFFAILVLSGLQYISSELYEAARVDGASSVQCFARITLPLVARHIVTLCIPFTLWRLTTFDIVYAMTSGGPGTDTSLIAYKISIEAFRSLNVGYSAALAILLFFVMLIFTVINRRVARRFEV